MLRAGVAESDERKRTDVADLLAWEDREAEISAARCGEARMWCGYVRRLATSIAMPGMRAGERDPLVHRSREV